MMHSAMTFPTRQAALGVLIVAALSLNASALHVPGRPLGGTMPELQRRAGVERIEALRGGAPLTAVKECFGVRLRSPFHKPAPPPPPPPPVRRTFKERYFKLVETLTLLFPVWTVGLSLIALYNPDRFEWLTTESTTLLEIGGYRLEMDPYTLFLSITMLSMGTNLTPQDFRPIARSVVPISVALLFQYGVTPLIGWAIGQLLPAPLAVGLVLLASCPGSQASNVACFIAGGDLPVSIVMTLLSCSVCAFMTPLLVRLLADASVSVPGVGMMLSLLKVIILPTVSGLLLNICAPSLTALVKPITPLLGVLLTSCLCAAPIAGVADVVLEQGLSLLLPVLLLHSLSFLLGYAVPRHALQMSERAARTISIEAGMQSAALGYLLARKHFSDALTAVPSAVGVLVMSSLGALISISWRLQDAR